MLGEAQDLALIEAFAFRQPTDDSVIAYRGNGKQGRDRRVRPFINKTSQDRE